MSEEKLKLELLKLADGSTAKAQEMFSWIKQPAYIVTNNGIDKPVDVQLVLGAEMTLVGQTRSVMLASYGHQAVEAFDDFMSLDGATLHTSGFAPDVSMYAEIVACTACGGVTPSFKVGDHQWGLDHGDANIVAYRLLGEKAPAAPADKAISTLPPGGGANVEDEGLLVPQSPSVDDEVRNQAEGVSLVEFMRRTGAVKWEAGGLDIKPVRNGIVVEYLLRDGHCDTEHASILRWSAGEGSLAKYDIIAYRIIETPAEAERIEDDRKGTQATEQELKDEGTPVLDAEPSPILRSDLDPSTETFLAPSGDEFAKKNGETRLIVSDEQEAEGHAETDPAAAYAHINEVDEPASDAAVFARGMMEEAKAEAEAQKFNPFRLFRQKEPA